MSPASSLARSPLAAGAGLLLAVAVVIAWRAGGGTGVGTPSVVLGALTGVVTDEAGTPLAGVRVRAFAEERPAGVIDEEEELTRTPLRSGESGPDGVFVLRDVPPPTGPWGEAWEAAPHPRTAVPARRIAIYLSRPSRATVRTTLSDAASVRRPMSVRLPPAASISGRITTADGLPAAGLILSRSGASDLDHGLPEFGVWSAVTDADGRYELQDLAPFRVDDAASNADAPGVDAPGVDAPGVDAPDIDAREADRDRRVGFQLRRPGPNGTLLGQLKASEAPAEHDIVLPPHGAVSGVVIDNATGKPAPDIGVRWVAVDGGPNSAWSDYQDRWSLTLPSGNLRRRDVRFWFEASSYARTDDTGRYTLPSVPPIEIRTLVDRFPDDRIVLTERPRPSVRAPAGGHVEAPILELHEGGVVRGRFLNPDGSPLATLPAPDQNPFNEGKIVPTSPHFQLTEKSTRITYTVGSFEGRFSRRVPSGMYEAYLHGRFLPGLNFFLDEEEYATPEWIPQPWMKDGFEVREGETVELI